MTGIAMLWILIYVNSSVKMATRLLGFLFVIKVASLALIVLGGVYWMVSHGTDKLSNSFAGEIFDCNVVRKI